MRVGLVMHGLDRPMKGVTRVAIELAQALQKEGSCELVLMFTSRSRLPSGDAPIRSTYLPGCGRVPALMILGGPMIAVAARRLRLDIVHDPVGVSPFTLGRWAGSFRRVVTIHDAIPFRYPQAYSWSNNFLHRRYVPATLRNVDRVITISEHARTDLQAYLGLHPDFVSVVPNGVSERFAPVEPDMAQRVAAKYGLDRPFILNVTGRVQPRKNIGRLLQSFAQLQPRLSDHVLALAGARVSESEHLRRSIADLHLNGKVMPVGAVAEDDLPALYSAARLFVLPSLFEGFGLPIVEAMACGTPVVSSNATSLPEVAGDAACLIDPLNEDQLAEAMYQVLTDEALRASLRWRGLERVKQFSWGSTARGTLDVYRRVLAASHQTTIQRSSIA